MIQAALLVLPLVAALLAAAIHDRLHSLRRVLLPLTAAAHLGLCAKAIAGGVGEPFPGFSDWLGLDQAGLLFAGLTGALFFAVSVYIAGDLRRHALAPYSERTYIALLLFFLFAMTALCMGRNMLVIWIAVTAASLASVKLVNFRQTPESLKAARKYLAACLAGAAMALLGVVLLAIAAGGAAASGPIFSLERLSATVSRANPLWLKAAFILLLAGYGTSMGLAPMHIRLPDAHSEAPPPVSALLSGALLNGAFLAIVRALGIMSAAGLGEFAACLLRPLGLFSMALAGILIMRQKDFRRLLACSSVGHVGMLAFAAGLGAAGLWAAFFHAVNHALAKGCLFLTAGNISHHYRSRSILSVTGARREMPYSGSLWLIGFIALSGLPPFGMFFSEFAALKAAFAGGRIAGGALYLLFLTAASIGMVKVALGMLRGKAEGAEERSESPWMAIPPIFLAVCVLALGLAVPDFLGKLVTGAVRVLDADFQAMPGVRP